MLDYERLTVRDLKRIVNREEATPAAIGLFVVYDFWEREHGRRTIVDNKLLRHIESKWAYTAYANELDYWLELGGQLRSLELQAIGQGLKAQIGLQNAESLIAQTLVWFYADFYTQLIEQAEPLKIDLQEHRERLERFNRAEVHPINLPSEEELKAVATDIRSHTASFLGYLPVMGAAERLLGIPLTEQIVSEGVALAPWAEKQETQLKESGQVLEKYWPDKARELRRLIAIGSVRPSPEVMTNADRTLAAYLSPNWREWVRAGVNLREIADMSKGVADLIRHAELAAVELKHE